MSFVIPDDEVRRRLAETFPAIIPAEGDLPVEGPMVPLQDHLAFARFLKEDLGFTLYVSVIATHFPEEVTEGEGDDAKTTTRDSFEVATVLRRPSKPSWPMWWRVKTEGEIHSLVHLFAGADWQEREQYDLVGVTFTGHPDLRRLMMPEDWPGHPLRKDYAIDTPHAPWR